MHPPILPPSLPQPQETSLVPRLLRKWVWVRGYRRLNCLLCRCCTENCFGADREQKRQKRVATVMPTEQLTHWESVVFIDMENQTCSLKWELCLIPKTFIQHVYVSAPGLVWIWDLDQMEHLHCWIEYTPEEVWQGQKVITEMIMCLYNPNGDQTRGFFTAVPLNFHHSDQILDSPNNMLANNALHPWGSKCR